MLPPTSSCPLFAGWSHSRDYSFPFHHHHHHPPFTTANVPQRWRWCRPLSTALIGTPHHPTPTQQRDHTTSHEWPRGPGTTRSPKHPAPTIDNAGRQRHAKTGDARRQMTREEEATCDEESTRDDNGMPTRNDNGRGPSLTTHAQRHPPAPALPALHQSPTTLSSLHQSSSVPPPSTTPFPFFSF